MKDECPRQAISSSQRLLASKAFVWLATLAIEFCVVIPAGAEFAEANVETLAGSIARVRVVNDNRRPTNGSAVAVRENMVVTSCHGTRNASLISVMNGGQRWQVKSVTRDGEHDLCLLELSEANLKPFPLAEPSTTLELGDYVAAVGFAGPTLTIAEGTVKALHQHDNARVIQTDAAFRIGESGGALVNREGKLVGILTFYLAGEKEGAYFALPAAWVERLVQSAVSRQAPVSQPDVSFWERPDEERALFLRALAREYTEDWKGLKQVASQWVVQESENAEAWIALGKSHFYIDEVGAAAKALREAIRLAPRHAEGWLYLGRSSVALKDAGGFEEALQRLETLDLLAAEALRKMH